MFDNIVRMIFSFTQGQYLLATAEDAEECSRSDEKHQLLLGQWIPITPHCYIYELSIVWVSSDEESIPPFPKVLTIYIKNKVDMLTL